MQEIREYFTELLPYHFQWMNAILALGILLSTLILKKIFDVFISKKLLSLTKKTSFRYDDEFINAINPPISALFFVAGLFAATQVLQLPETPLNIAKFVVETLKISIAAIVTWAAYRQIDILALFVAEKVDASEDEAIRLHFLPLIRKTLKSFVIVIGALLVVQNLGYSIGSLLTGLGLGGLAVALAAQESLSNFFGSVVILTDRSFKLGDWIQIGETDGIVEDLGLRSTKLRTWANSLVTIPNKVFANERIENWTAMNKRRVSMKMGLTYDSSPEAIQKMVIEIETLLKNHPAIDPDLIIVSFTDFSDSSLDLTLLYFTRTTALKEYLQIKQEINLKIMKISESLGLSFAFPSRTLYWGPNERPSHSP